MGDDIVSVIIPAYNAGRYLRDMLESIYAQTYSSLEIIVAYDTKSSDNTLDILKEYEDRYQLIIDEGNDSSSGQARNRGLRLAKGEFVIFMDADDLIIPSYIENLIDIYLKHPYLDVVCGNRILSDEEDVKEKYDLALLSPRQIQIHSRDESLNHMISGKLYCGEPWTWLVKKEYLESHSIRFPDYSYGDDTAYVFRLIVNTSHVGYSTKQGYVFIRHSSSITHSVSSFVDLYDKRARSRNDIGLILGDNYNDIYLQHVTSWNRSLASVMTLSDYDTFNSALNSHKIEKLGVIYGDSLLSKMGVLCFNQSKFLYWILRRVLRMCGL